jgi:hypothetical protein
MKALICAAMLLLCASAFAQEFRGTILGRVTDSSGGIVAGAEIRVVNADTNVAVNSTSNQDGNYQVPFLNPGNYNVIVDHPGFKKIERQGVRVSVTAQIALDFALEVGAVSETVNVTASAPLLNTNDADLGQVINSN